MSKITYRTVISAGGSEPVSVTQARLQLKVGSSNSAYDNDINEMLPAARDKVEQLTNRYWSQVNIRLGFDNFPSGNRPLYLPVPDIDSVTDVEYLDENQDIQNLTGFTVDTKRQVLIYTDGWPVGSNVLVDLVAGPDNDASPAPLIPAGITQGILMYMTDYFENRASQVPYNLINNQAANNAVWPYRVNMGI